MKRNKSLIGFLMVCLVVMSSFLISFDSKAAGYVVNSVHSQPIADDNSGYINVLVDTPDLGNRLYTIVWNIVPTKVDSSSDRDGQTQMNIVVNSSSIELTAIVHGQKGYCTAFELISDGNAYLLKSAQIANTVTFTSGYSGSIVAVSVYGNYGTFNTFFGTYVPQVSVVWNEDSRSYSQLAQIVSSLNTLNINLGGKLDTLVSRVNALITEVDNVEELLASINDLISQYYPDFKTELQNIVDRLDTLIKQSAADKNVTDKFASDSKSQADSINGLNQQSQSEKVDINTASGSVDSYIDTNAISSYSGVLASFTGNPHILQFILIVLAVGLVSYVLFGKR